MIFCKKIIYYVQNDDNKQIIECQNHLNYQSQSMLEPL